MRISILLLFLCPMLTAQVIPPSTFKIETLSGQDNAALSFDGNTGTSWFPGWSTDRARCQITFDGTYKIDRVRYFDGTGQPKLAIYTRSPQPISTIPLIFYQVWQNEKLGIETDQLTFEIQGIQGDKVIPEIEIHGRRLGSEPPADTVVTPPIPPIPFKLTGVGDRICLNGFHWVPFDNIKGVFSKKRDFQMSSWTWTERGFSPQPLAGAISPTVQGYDDYLTDAKAAGVEIIPCVNQTPPFFWGIQQNPVLYFLPDNVEGEYPVIEVKGSMQMAMDSVNAPPMFNAAGYDPDAPPADPGFAKDDPAAYKRYAEFLFQYAARYGSVVWPDEALRVDMTQAYPNAPVNEKKSGLGLLKRLEPWNEFDRWWKGAGWDNEPEKLAAFLSACYDGHGGTLGKYCGIKTADEKLQVLMPGLTGPDLKYYKRMVDWCTTHRPGGTLAWDICNFHHYSNTTNEAGRWPPTWQAGAPADMDAAWVDVQDFVKYGHALGQEVWWTEMGYDSKPPSWQYAVPYGAMTGDQLQAIWLVRNYLMSFRAGIDQTFMFNAINEPGAPNGGLYQNTGLFYGLGDVKPFTPKPAYTMVAWLQRELNGFSYAGDISPAGKVKMLKFTSGSRTRIAMWMATADESTAQVKLDGRQITVTETPQILQLKPKKTTVIGKVIDKILGPKGTPVIVRQ